MCNWILKFSEGVFYTVFCETEEEAIQLASMVELFVPQEFLGEANALG